MFFIGSLPRCCFDGARMCTSFFPRLAPPQNDLGFQFVEWLMCHDRRHMHQAASEHFLPTMLTMVVKLTAFLPPRNVGGSSPGGEDARCAQLVPPHPTKLLQHSLFQSQPFQNGRRSLHGYKKIPEGALDSPHIPTPLQDLSISPLKLNPKTPNPKP